MKRLLSASLAAWMLLQPIAAEAGKLLVVSYRIDSGGFQADQYRLAQRRLEQSFQHIADRLGIEYRLVDARNTKTLWAATGTQVWGSPPRNPTTLQWTEQFDATVHLGYGAQTGALAAANGGAAQCRPESMTFIGSTKAPTVPQLFVIGNQGVVPATLDDADTTDGVSGINAPPADFVGRMMYFGPDQAIRVIDPALTDPVVRTAAAPPGGYRTLIGAAGGSLTSTTGVDFGSLGGGVNCTWCDSIFAPSSTRDSVLMWERPMAHIAGAQPIVFASVANDGLGVLDSITNANAGTLNPPVEMSAFLLLAGLARIDSLTGGDIIPKTRPPVKLGVTVDGGFAHNTRMHPRGSAVDDSAIVKASIDSIVAYNQLQRPKIKITLGVNIDSVESYPNEKAWWSALGPNIRYSPQSWVAIADTAKGGGNASFDNPRDPLGRFRPRALLGDTSTYDGADSSMYKLLRGSIYKTGVLFGHDRVSRLLMPADDDWSPRNSTSDGIRLMDSTLFAIHRAGFNAIRVNGVDRDCDPGYLRANHKGFAQRQGWYTSNVRNTRMRLLAYNGYPLGGASRQVLACLDTAASPFFKVKMHSEIARAWNGMFLDGWLDYEMFPYDGHYIPSQGDVSHRFYDGVEWNQKDRVFPYHRRANLMRLSVNDLSGASTRPARLGWHTLKSLGNLMEMVNRLAGRTIVEFGWPEDIDPQ